ncbi:NAD(P)/FAD-dependent oxidoreductase [Streptomyces tardus]|uniref:NAD(P)/FAD-dependent oxidoreductase n=1 Tax=Streptomyces tardus TaxID=2780544 RepID=UPI0035574743
MYTALRLQKKLKAELKRGRAHQNADDTRADADTGAPADAASAKAAEAPAPESRSAPDVADTGVEIVVVSPEPYMTYQPFLPEAGAGSISPRHVVVPLRRVLSECRIVVGEARSIDHAARRAHIRTIAADQTSTGSSDSRTASDSGSTNTTDTTGADGANLALDYDELVLAPGSVSRTLPVPGLADHGIGFKTVEEAIGLRNHVLEQLDIASSTRNPEIRDAALTFVFVGGGYAGVEALGELEDMARHACGYYHNLRPEEQKWILVEATDRILPEVGEEMGKYAVRELRGRRIDVRLETRLDSCEDRVAVLSDGSRHPCRTLVWTAGVKPSPVLAATDLPRNERGRLRCRATLQIEGTPNAWAAGDAAAVPDLTNDEPGQECAPNAQHAVRQARLLGDNLVASLRGKPLVDYEHAYAGSVASLGLHKGVARVYGRKLKGYPAWLMHRVYHLSRVPTVNRKMRVLSEWVLSGFFKREIVSLGSLEHPRAEFEIAAGGGPRTEER